MQRLTSSDLESCADSGSSVSLALVVEVRRLRALLCEAHKAATASGADPYDWTHYVDVAAEVMAIRSETLAERNR